MYDGFVMTLGVSGEAFADVDKALDERTIGHNPERLCLMKVIVIEHPQHYSILRLCKSV